MRDRERQRERLDLLLIGGVVVNVAERSIRNINIKEQIHHLDQKEHIACRLPHSSVMAYRNDLVTRLILIYFVGQPS